MSLIIAMRDGRIEHAGTVAEIITAEILGILYDTPAAVEQLRNRRVVMWGELD
jgi:ABC-type enterochelin transport system ATPase subunit